MSASIIRIIPEKGTMVFAQGISDKVVDYLNNCLNADSINVMVHDKIVFVDCGSNLEQIGCPVCGSSISFEWWGETMEKASLTDFAELAIELPCCGKRSSLNDLNYQFPCGFARWVIEIVEPEPIITKEIMEGVEHIVNAKIRLVEAHY